MSEYSQLKWQCRRGVKELDLLLTNYLEHHYSIANKNEQAAFKQLLTLEDPVLFALLLENKSIVNILLQNIQS
jgi:antitoxin CptB